MVAHESQDKLKQKRCLEYVLEEGIKMQPRLR